MSFWEYFTHSAFTYATIIGAIVVILIFWMRNRKDARK
ncbi:MAG TPA: EYxxD motif small membrane protein [Bacillales bacterium]|nr:EYxxD motif small membrane protein [Bacillales bacterium]